MNNTSKRKKLANNKSSLSIIKEYLRDFVLAKKLLSPFFLPLPTFVLALFVSFAHGIYKLLTAETLPKGKLPYILPGVISFLFTFITICT